MVYGRSPCRGILAITSLASFTGPSVRRLKAFTSFRDTLLGELASRPV